MAAACVPQPNLVTVQPHSFGPPGTKVTVVGLGFEPGRKEVRWNAPDGLLLGSTDGPNFSVPVTIPDATNGLHHLVVISRSGGGEVGNTGVVAFQVTATPVVSPPMSPPPVRFNEQTQAPASPMSVLDVVLAAGIGALGSLAGMVLLVLFRRFRASGLSGDAT